MVLKITIAENNTANNTLLPSFDEICIQKPQIINMSEYSIRRKKQKQKKNVHMDWFHVQINDYIKTLNLIFKSVFRGVLLNFKW